MQQVREVMTRGVRSVSAQDTLLHVAQAMAELDVGAMPVVEGSRVTGLITDRDIVLRGVATELPMRTATAGDLMTEHIECVFEDEGLDEVVARMQGSKIRRLPVLDSVGRLVGMLSLGDLAARSDAAVAGFTLAEISAPSRPRRADDSDPVADTA